LIQRSLNIPAWLPLFPKILTRSVPFSRRRNHQQRQLSLPLALCCPISSLRRCRISHQPTPLASIRASSLSNNVMGAQMHWHVSEVRGPGCRCRRAQEERARLYTGPVWEGNNEGAPSGRCKAIAGTEYMQRRKMTVFCPVDQQGLKYLRLRLLWIWILMYENYYF
jgi:hypothetical protein